MIDGQLGLPGSWLDEPAGDRGGHGKVIYRPVLGKRRRRRARSDEDGGATGWVKPCNRCHRMLPLEAFHSAGRKRSWGSPLCRECKREAYNTNGRPDLLKKYGITIEEYDAMLDRQGGLCAICRGPETAIDGRTGVVRRLHIDHCHSTGRVRGLLCHGCNQGIGGLRDRVDLLVSAIDYLRSANAD